MKRMGNSLSFFFKTSYISNVLTQEPEKYIICHSLSLNDIAYKINFRHARSYNGEQERMLMNC